MIVMILTSIVLIGCYVGGSMRTTDFKLITVMFSKRGREGIRYRPSSAIFRPTTVFRYQQFAVTVTRHRPRPPAVYSYGNASLVDYRPNGPNKYRHHVQCRYWDIGNVGNMNIGQQSADEKLFAGKVHIFLQRIVYVAENCCKAL